MSNELKKIKMYKITWGSRSTSIDVSEKRYLEVGLNMSQMYVNVLFVNVGTKSCNIFWYVLVRVIRRNVLNVIVSVVTS